MRNLFVSIQIALLMKELGFDELCFQYYWEKSDELMGLNGSYKNNTELTYSSKHNQKGLNGTKFCAMPTKQQAFKWFRDVHNIDGYPQRCGQGFAYQIYKNFGSQESESIPQKGWNYKYEECEELLLNKLISMVIPLPSIEEVEADGKLIYEYVLTGYGMCVIGDAEIYEYKDKRYEILDWNAEAEEPIGKEIRIKL